MSGKHLTDKDLLLQFQSETGTFIKSEKELQNLKTTVPYVEWLEKHLLIYKNFHLMVEQANKDFMIAADELEVHTCSKGCNCNCGGCDE